MAANLGKGPGWDWKGQRVLIQRKLSRFSARRAAATGAGWIIAIAGLCTIAAGGVASASVSSELAFHRGLLAFSAERLEDAKREFKTVLSEEPDDTTALQYLALIATAEGDLEAAIALYERAQAIDPKDPEIQLDLSIALLEVGRTAEAREKLEALLTEDPERAQAQLMAGIAAYRSADYESAVPHLDKAGELDPELLSEARYYTGLCQVLLRRYELADGAFSDVEQQSPVSPLAQSATQLREQMRALPEDRRWWAAVTIGLEGDSNPTVAGSPISRDPDGRFVMKPQAELNIFERDGTLISAGYDGYLSVHFDEQDVDLQTHSAFLAGETSLGLAQLSLRYDFAATWIDLTNPFRTLHRVIPAVSIPIGDSGVTQIYYQWLHHDFSEVDLSAPVSKSARQQIEQSLDRSGNQNVIALNHFFFLPKVLDYLRIGALGEFYDADGSEYTYRGWEVSAGVGAPLPLGIHFVGLYRYIERNYRNNSLFDPIPHRRRNDSIHRLSLDFVRPVGAHWEVSLRGLFNFTDSNIPTFDYNRHSGGAYVTYLF